MFQEERHVNFNSHPHEEDDLCECEGILGQIHFNSHPHEEDDVSISERLRQLRISTHILTKRMTLRHVLLLLRFLHFNSHPHEEDDGRTI